MGRARETGLVHHVAKCCVRLVFAAAAAVTVAAAAHALEHTVLKRIVWIVAAELMSLLLCL